MFLCQPLLEVLAGRGIEDIDAFLKVPSWNDLPDPFTIPSMEQAATRVLCAVRRRERIVIHGDYDCDGILGAHILRSALTGLGAAPRTYLPHRDEGYGLNSPTVHRFSCTGTDLLITVDNGINARAAVRLTQRLGIDVVVIDHHRIQEQVQTTAVWSDAFCGAGLAAMFAWALALKARWNDSKNRTPVIRVKSICSDRFDRRLCALVAQHPNPSPARSRRTLAFATQMSAGVAHQLLQRCFPTGFTRRSLRCRTTDQCCRQDVPSG